MSEDERLRSYLDAVDWLATLTDSEIRDLAGAIEPQSKADDVAATAEQVVARRDAARKRLIEGNLRMVVAIADQYRDHGVPLGALLEAGNLGLVGAVQDFDWRWPSEFPRRATAAIHGAIAAAISGANSTALVEGWGRCPVTAVRRPPAGPALRCREESPSSLNSMDTTERDVGMLLLLDPRSARRIAG